jgi:hypothetical protein
MTVKITVKKLGGSVFWSKSVLARPSNQPVLSELCYTNIKSARKKSRGENRKQKSRGAKTASKKVEGVRRKPQAKRQNREGERKKSRGCGENRKRNGKTMGESKNSRGGAAKTASETAKP